MVSDVAICIELSAIRAIILSAWLPIFINKIHLNTLEYFQVSCAVYNVNTRITDLHRAVANLSWCNESAQCAAMSLTVYVLLGKIRWMKRDILK